MVHALELVHRCLDPVGGQLLDIHPFAVWRRLSIRMDHHCWAAGRLADLNMFDAYRAADQALADVVGRGLFVQQEKRRFGFRVHCDTFNDLLDYLREDRSTDDETDDTLLDPVIAERVKQLLLTPGRQRRVILHKPVRIQALARA